MIDELRGSSSRGVWISVVFGDKSTQLTRKQQASGQQAISKACRRRSDDAKLFAHGRPQRIRREYFGDQLRTQQREAWKECNRWLYNYYRALASQLPNSFREMEPLFLAAICGCNAGLFREALHEIYIPRIQREDDSFAANILGARGQLLSVLIHFFEDGRWESPVRMGAEGRARGQNLLRARGILVSSPQSTARSRKRNPGHQPLLDTRFRGDDVNQMCPSCDSAAARVSRRAAPPPSGSAVRCRPRPNMSTMMKSASTAADSLPSLPA